MTRIIEHRQAALGRGAVELRVFQLRGSDVGACAERVNLAAEVQAKDHRISHQGVSDVLRAVGELKLRE
jgi:hypothetical protein